jgi:S1-C subfamily serine protease
LEGSRAAGTGIVLTATGEVLTNNHVIAGATSISATDVGNGQTYDGTVLGYNRSADIALIQLKGASGLKTATIGDAAVVKAGDSIVALGNAGGKGGDPSVAPGTVVATGQSITATDEDGSNAERLTNLIQVAANIQPGDSGGPLANAAGRVIGMDTAAATDFQFQASGGQGFAIPINQAVAVAKDIKAGRASDTIHVGATGLLGVGVAAVTGNTAAGSATGAQVSSVISGSPAARAGLRRGDQITSIDGRAVDQPATVTAVLDRHHPGDRVAIGFTDRNGDPKTVTVTLAVGPAG